jgi:hypothetical protein
MALSAWSTNDSALQLANRSLAINRETKFSLILKSSVHMPLKSVRRSLSDLRRQELDIALLQNIASKRCKKDRRRPEASGHRF